VSGPHLCSSVLPAMSRAVNRICLLFSLLVAFVLSGCATSDKKHHQHYRKVRETDLEGHLVAEYVAEGDVWRYGRGYRFKAMQRTIGGPYRITSRYPQGRKVLIHGANIVVMPCGKPYWLYQIDGF